MPNLNAHLGRDYIKAFQDQDYVWLDRYIAPEFVRHDDGLPFEVRGPEGIRKLGAFMHGAFSEVELAVSDVVSEGDRVLVHLRMRGKHTGDFNGHAATGKRIDAEVMDLSARTTTSSWSTGR